tara:strand:- start:264 stop:584 length:321 start_codon:yes stop_codon:yes gene_type:complete
MVQKKLEKESKYAKYDLDGDGVVDDNELSAIKEIEKAEAESRKLLAQRRMATAALISMGIFTILLFTPLVPLERLAALSDVSNLFYISMAGIVGTYMGTTAWMNRK